MWYDILKVQITGNKQKVKMGNIPIPVDDGGDCWLRLKRAMEYIQGEAVHFQTAEYRLNEVPEEVACTAIELFDKNTILDYAGGEGVVRVINGYRCWVGAYLDDDVELILSIRPQISDPNVKSTKSIWLHYRTVWNYNLSNIDVAVEYNEKIFNIIKKFLNMIGQEPYYKSNFIDADFLNRRKRGGV